MSVEQVLYPLSHLPSPTVCMCECMCVYVCVLDSLTLTNSNLLPFIDNLGFGELLLNKTIKQFSTQLTIALHYTRN